MQRGKNVAFWENGTTWAMCLRRFRRRGGATRRRGGQTECKSRKRKSDKQTFRRSIRQARVRQSLSQSLTKSQPESDKVSAMRSQVAPIGSQSESDKVRQSLSDAIPDAILTRSPKPPFSTFFACRLPAHSLVKSSNIPPSSHSSRERIRSE